MASCLLYREIQRAVLSSKLFNAEREAGRPVHSYSPLCSATMTVRGLIAESKRDDLGDIDAIYIDVEDRERIDRARQLARWENESPEFWAKFEARERLSKALAREHAELGYEDMIVDAEFEDIPSLPVKPVGPRPVVRQEDGKPLMYVDSYQSSLDALRGSAHGAWMDRKGDN